MTGYVPFELLAALIAGAAIGWLIRSRFPVRNRGLAKLSEIPPDVGDSTEAQGGRQSHKEDVGPSRPGPTLGDARLPAARKILVHLLSLGRLGEDDVARRGFTQAGMVEALGLSQGTIAKTLTRLEAANVLKADRRHVEGQPTRLKVYRLTPLGESVARDARRQLDRSEHS